MQNHCLGKLFLFFTPPINLLTHMFERFFRGKWRGMFAVNLNWDSSFYTLGFSVIWSVWQYKQGKSGGGKYVGRLSVDGSFDRRSVTKVRTGHNGLNSHLLILGLSDILLCPPCSTEEESVGRFLLRCANYLVAREDVQLFLQRVGIPPSTLSTLLEIIDPNLRSFYKV
ncbi:hypothetical protein Anas_00591 [Armadillidium nasatum]|uniref:Uncharacterized protein n=1 Tax=Armadillidium nasatum TaxID=96803 RepID=A0A5N5TIC9_9CRUS|nr:hypothetical protein Anas_00591 [Armadillidium nasatum]